MATYQDAVRETVALIRTCEATDSAILRDYTKAIVAATVATAATQETAAPAATSGQRPPGSDLRTATSDARPDWMLVLDARKAIAASASARATPATAWPSVPAAAAIAASASTSATPATAATGATD